MLTSTLLRIGILYTTEIRNRRIGGQPKPLTVLKSTSTPKHNIGSIGIMLASAALTWVAFLAAMIGTLDAAVLPPSNNLQRGNSLTDARPVKVHVTLKRHSMTLHGHSEFDIFANPIVHAMDSRVRYDGHTTFQGNGGTQLTYALVNGTGYMITKDEVGTSQTVECLRPGALSFNDILPALNDAVPIPSASIGDETIECTSGNIFKTTFAGAHFAICLSDKSGFKAYSSDIDIEVEYLENSVEVKLPVLGSGSSCEVVANPSSVTPITLALLTGSAISTSASRNLKAAEHMAMEAPSCKCKSTPRPCVFFHGNGNMNEMNELQDTPEKTNNRMGNMNDHTPCCTEVKYAVLNTRDNMWTNDSMQQKFCDYALQLSETSDVELGIIKDTVVVTHSMGGLIMSMALARGKCSFGEGSSWVAISTPTMGSMAADFLEDVCNDEFTVVASGLFKLLGKCPVPASRKSLVYQNEKYSTDNLNAAYRAAQEAYRGNVTAAMCSNDYNGIFSKYEAVLILAGKIFPHKSSENDGLVEYKGCALGLDESRFGSSYKDQFYKPELNHADTAFLTGDGYFKNSQKPVKWFECLL